MNESVVLENACTCVSTCLCLVLMSTCLCLVLMPFYLYACTCCVFLMHMYFNAYVLFMPMHFSCLCTIMPIYNYAYVQLSLCTIMSMYNYVYVQLCLCSFMPLYLFLYSFMSIFRKSFHFSNIHPFHIKVCLPIINFP